MQNDSEDMISMQRYEDAYYAPAITPTDQFSDLEMLTKLFTAFNLLGEVLSHDSPFTSELLPACSEKFLQQANYKLNQLQYKIQYQSEQSGA